MEILGGIKTSIYLEGLGPVLTPGEGIERAAEASPLEGEMLVPTLTKKTEREMLAEEFLQKEMMVTLLQQVKVQSVTQIRNLTEKLTSQDHTRTGR